MAAIPPKDHSVVFVPVCGKCKRILDNVVVETTPIELEPGKVMKCFSIDPHACPYCYTRFDELCAINFEQI